MRISIYRQLILEFSGGEQLPPRPPWSRQWLILNFFSQNSIAVGWVSIGLCLDWVGFGSIVMSWVSKFWPTAISDCKTRTVDHLYQSVSTCLTILIRYIHFVHVYRAGYYNQENLLFGHVFSKPGQDIRIPYRISGLGYTVIRVETDILSILDLVNIDFIQLYSKIHVLFILVTYRIILKLWLNI